MPINEDVPIEYLEGFALLTMIGEYYRLDWSDFDGRTLRSQLRKVRDALRAELQGDPGPAFELLEEWKEALQDKEDFVTGEV